MMDKERPITDTMTVLTCHGLFSRFPDLRVISVENGAEWVAPFIKNLKSGCKKMPQAFAENPIDAFRRCVSVCPFHEDDFDELQTLLGIDNLCFGSDYPHPEALPSHDPSPTNYLSRGHCRIGPPSWAATSVD